MCIHIFYLTVWFLRERFKALLAVNIMEVVFFPWSWQLKVMKAEIGGRAMVVGTWW
jgi:hypothetical protein